MKTTEKILWVIAGLSFLIGLAGLYNRISGGHLVVAYNTYVPWGLWIAVYITLVGVSVGAFFIAVLGYGFGVKAVQPLGRMSLLVALAALVGGLTSVWIDLGRIERVFYLYQFTSPKSVMGWMTWFYTLYGILLLVMLYLTWKQPASPSLRVLGLIGLPFAILFGGAEGSLFGVVSARSLWESGLVPILFLLEGAFSGVALMLFLSILFGEYGPLPFLRNLTLALLFSVFALEASEYFTALYASIPAKIASLEIILFGEFWWVFWIAHLGLGLVVPLLLLLFAPQNRIALAVSGALAAFMALATKLNLVIPALVVPELEGLRTAYVGPGLSLDYFPTLSEWLIALWTVSLAGLVFLAGYRFLSAKQSAV
jgi:molybdopterin-containing oxidoreductase family membrane subunit